MALVWMDGFEVDDAGLGINFTSRKYQTTGTPGSGTGRLQGKAFSGNGVSITTPSLGTDQTWIFGFGVKTSSFGNDQQYWQLLSGGVPQFTMRLNASRQIELRRGDTNGTILATGTTQIPNNDWAWIEVKVVLDHSGSPTVGQYEVRINTILEMQDAGPIRTSETVSNADQFRISCPSGTSTLVDDLYILDSNSSGANDFLGDQVIEGLKSSGAGASTQWTVVGAAANWDAVNDDSASSGGNNDWVESDTNGQIDYYEFDDLGFITGSINGVAFSFHARMELVASSRVIRGRFRDSLGNSGPFPQRTVNGTTVAGQIAILEEDPTSVSTPWAISEINNGQFGLEVVS